MSTIIYTEFARNNIELDKPIQKSGWFMKAKSEETIMEERRVQKYERRSNRCDVCFTQKSVTGSCNC